MIHQYLKIGSLAIVCTLLLTGPAVAQKPNVAHEFKYAALQTNYMLKQIETTIGDPKLVSPRTFENGKFKMVASNDWTSGFFAGQLWFLYEQTKEQKWLDEARIFTDKLAKEQFNKSTHDLGFMIYCSYGNGYRLTKNEGYKKSYHHCGTVIKYPFQS